MTKRKAVIDLRDVDRPVEEEESSTPSSSLRIDAQDLGHRIGNFYNYYAFHPPSHRLDMMQDMLNYIGRKYKKKENDNDDDDGVFEYCDLGCNQGDLTIDLACALQKKLHSTTPPGTTARVHFCGIDVDPILIDRAKQRLKFLETNEEKQMVVTGDFQVGNICHDLDALLLEDKCVDMTSLLSTTMWIHIHAGDEGLRTALEKICQKTRKFVLIESQPSKCYRKAMTRLRKMGRPEVDVSSNRLKLRQNIEKEIDVILMSCGFTKVSLPSSSSSSSAEKEKTTTPWNRKVELYERIEE